MRLVSTVRPVLCLVLAASVVGGTAASQAAVKKKPAPKPVCNLVTDPKGDSSLSTAATLPGTGDDALDIVSADLAASAKTLTAAIRLVKVADTATTAPNGFSVVYTFTAPSKPDVPLYLRYFAGSPALDGLFEYGYDDPTNGLTPLGDAFGVVDTAKNEIRISAPLNGFDAQAPIKKNDKLAGFDVTTSRDLVVLLTYADRGTATTTYTVGAPSCVTPGK